MEKQVGGKRSKIHCSTFTLQIDIPHLKALCTWSLKLANFDKYILIFLTKNAFAVMGQCVLCLIGLGIVQTFKSESI